MSKAKAPRVFVPLTKVDEDQRLVYGRITQEVLDKSGEVMDYVTSKPFFEKWSNEISENSGGLSKGNVRVMHGLTAAGKLTELEFDDTEMAIDVCAKIVDDAEWNKVVEGVYTGFSVGGSYEKRWTDTIGDQKIKKFTARPNEVSIVDNPCVPSATFSYIKADGTEEHVAFVVEHDDNEWPGFRKAEEAPEGPKEDPAPEPPVEEQPAASAAPTNAEIAAVAEKMAKDAGTGSWGDYLDAAREHLLKADPQKKEDKKIEAEPDNKKGEETDSCDNSAKKAETTGVRDSVRQVWSCSDGSHFEKKADAEAHELSLKKAEAPAPTEADQLRARLEKALSGDELPVVTSVYDDFDRLSKAVDCLLTPTGEDGVPVLNKGMSVVSRFATVLQDIGILGRRIALESSSEGDDAADKKISEEIKAAMATLGETFKAYAAEQIAELIAGVDDEVCVSYYDYYYAAAKEDGDNQLAKDVCSIITDHRDAATERRETLAKRFAVETPEISDELSPVLQKRFNDLEKDRDDFKKVAEAAVEKIESLTKRIETIEDTPLPRAPRNVISKEGESLLKADASEEDKAALLKEMLEKHGPDNMATMMIKAAHSTGGQKLGLTS